MTGREGQTIDQQSQGTLSTRHSVVNCQRTCHKPQGTDTECCKRKRQKEKLFKFMPSKEPKKGKYKAKANESRAECVSNEIRWNFYANLNKLSLKAAAHSQPETHRRDLAINSAAMRWRPYLWCERQDKMDFRPAKRAGHGGARGGSLHFNRLTQTLFEPHAERENTNPSHTRVVCILARAGHLQCKLAKV